MRKKQQHSYEQLKINGDDDDGDGSCGGITFFDRTNKRTYSHLWQAKTNIKI